MADQETRRRTRAAREAAKDGGASAVSAAHEITAPHNELDSVERQEEILNPVPVLTTVGGRDIVLYELPAKQARAFLGLLSLVFAEARERPGEIIPRLQGVLASNEAYCDQFVAFVARATLPASAAPEQLANVPNIAREINESTTFREIGKLLIRMSDLNGAFAQRPN